MGSVTSIKRDPSPGASASDGSVIRTDMQNLIADVLEGKKDGEHINLLAPFATKTTTYTIAEEDVGILANTNGGGFTLTLPAAATLGIKRKIVIIKKIDAANTLTVDGNASETIDGAATIALTKLNETVILVSDNTNWRIVSWYNKTLTADLSVDSNKIINLTDPSSAQDAATKAYVDNLLNGVKWKAPVRVATTAALTLASDFENGDTVDGVTLATGDRILIKDQASGAENGIYTVNASGAPTRATDYDADSEVAQSACYVREGTANADQGFVLTNNGAITVGTTALVFVQFTGLGQVTAGVALTKTGNTIDFDLTELSAETDVDSDANDLIIIYKANGTVHRKISVDNFFKGQYIIPVPVGALYRKTTGSTSEDLTHEEMATNKINVKKFPFDQSTQEAIQISTPTPDLWDGGTVEVQFIWKSAFTSGVVRWGAKGRSYGDAETLDQALGTGQEVDDTQTGTANQVLISGWTPAITLAGTPAGGEFIVLELYRAAAHANDTLAGDAGLLGVRIRLTTNKKADA